MVIPASAQDPTLIRAVIDPIAKADGAAALHGIYTTSSPDLQLGVRGYKVG